MIYDELERYVGAPPDDPRYWDVLRNDPEKWFAVFTVLSGFLLKDADLFDVPRAVWPQHVERLARTITAQQEQIQAETIAEIRTALGRDWP
ncbi:MAG TPA: hypothetical protein VIE36_07270 [Methylomirabilota bacterium]|jgi:hypothetical protein